MKKYLTGYSVSLIFLTSLLMPFLLFLFRLGELDSLEAIVKTQINSKNNTLYGTAVNSDNYSYKRALLKHGEADIVALGSSRVMQFRQRMFSKPFINFGGGMNTLNEALFVVDEIVAKQPEVIILGLDIWWFNAAHLSSDRKVETMPLNKMRFQPEQIYRTLGLLRQGKLDLEHLFSTIVSGSKDFRIGLSAQYEDGFGKDGSYYYSRIISGAKHTQDYHFKDTLFRIAQGNRRFEYAEKADPKSIDKLVKLTSKLEEKNIKVILFFPPFAPTVIEQFAQKSKQYQYVKHLKSSLTDRSIQFYDYGDTNLLASSDCEFIDGFHGGEVNYSRILLDISKKEPQLASQVDENRLRQVVMQYNGFASIPDESISRGKEIDFLDIGCDKQVTMN